jgi:flagellin FlaB
VFLVFIRKDVKNMSKKGEMGIGTLVLFIAMILVAAIAAGVLIQTATSLQSKALETGKRSTTEVSTAMKTILLYGEDASTVRQISEVRQHVKLVAGADPIKFNDSVISVDTSNISIDWNLAPSQDYDNQSYCELANATGYRVYYIKEGTAHIDGYIVVGDVAELCYDLPRSVNEDELIRFNLIPKSGAVHSVTVTTPGTMISRRVFLYP